MGPIYATVDMQSTAEEKQQVAQDQPLGGVFSIRGTFVHRTCMAERDFHVVLKAVIRLVGVRLFCCVDAINVD